MFQNEDDDDFFPTSSNLSSIFNATNAVENSASLSYKAPKQPKPLDNEAIAETRENSASKGPQQSQSSVILAKVITLWKRDNNQNQHLGKHIAALIGDKIQNLFELIVYKEKTNILLRQSLNDNLVLYKYPKNFVGMFDSQKQFWNLNFETFENQESFLNELMLHKCQIIEQKSELNTYDELDNSLNSDLNHLNSLKVKNIPPKKEITELGVKEEETHASKNKILSRITKMGQQILPTNVLQRNTSTEQSDSETESSHSESRSVKPVTAPRKLKRNQNHDKALVAPQLNFTPNSYSSSSNPMYSNNNHMMLNPHNMLYTQPYPDMGLNNFVIAQNAELKANLAEINYKLNSILGGKVDQNGNNCECDELKSRVKCLNLKIENLSNDLVRSKRDYEKLLQRFELKCSEEVILQENKDHSEKLLEEVNKLKKELKEIEILRPKYEELNASMIEKDKLIAIKNLKLKDFEDFYKENLHIKEHFKNEVQELDFKIEELNLKLKENQEKLKQKQDILDNTVKSIPLLGRDEINKKIKETMNEAFLNIMENFSEGEEYSLRDIQRAVLENLKGASYSLINRLE